MKSAIGSDISIYSRLDSYLHTLAGDLIVESYCESFLQERSPDRDPLSRAKFDPTKVA